LFGQPNVYLKSTAKSTSTFDHRAETVTDPESTIHKKADTTGSSGC